MVMRLLAMPVTVTVALPVVVVHPGNEERPAVARAALFAAEVRRGRERLGKALAQAVGEEDLGTPGLALVHDARVLELFDESFFSPVTNRQQSVTAPGKEA